MPRLASDRESPADSRSRQQTVPSGRRTPAPDVRAARYAAGSSGTRPRNRHRPTPSRTHSESPDAISHNRVRFSRGQASLPSFPLRNSSPAGARNPATTVHPRRSRAVRAASRARMCCACTGLSDPDRERNARRSLWAQRGERRRQRNPMLPRSRCCIRGRPAHGAAKRDLRNPRWGLGEALGRPEHVESTSTLLPCTMTSYCAMRLHHASVLRTSLSNICCAHKIARCNSSAVTFPAELSRGKVPVASLRNSTPNPRCTAWRAVVSQHICVI